MICGNGSIQARPAARGRVDAPTACSIGSPEQKNEQPVICNDTARLRALLAYDTFGIFVMLRALSPYRRDAFEFIEQLDRLPTPGHVLKAMERALGCFGFEGFILTGIDRERSFDRQVLASGWPAEFFELYTRNACIRFDPIARLCRQSAVPFAWSEACYARERDPRALEVMDMAAQFRLRRGFAVPIRGPDGYEAAVGMAGVEIELPPGSPPAIHLMSIYAFERVRRLCGATAGCKPPLTHREREVLAWAAHGKSAGQIGEILGITKRTADEHTQSASRKLGAANRTQAVALALRDRIIEL